MTTTRAPLTIPEIRNLVQQLNRENTLLNEEFDALSEAERRVSMAWDVISKMRAGQFEPILGEWLHVKYNQRPPNGSLMGMVSFDTQVRDLLKDAVTCKGCALGGLLMCSVLRRNKLKVGDLSHAAGTYGFYAHYQDAQEHLGAYFSDRDLGRIEAAYEGGSGACRPRDSGVSKSFFADGPSEPEERMRLLMENIIVHHGTFTPSVRPKHLHADRWGPARWITRGFRELNLRYAPRTRRAAASGGSHGT